MSYKLTIKNMENGSTMEAERKTLKKIVGVLKEAFNCGFCSKTMALNKITLLRYNDKRVDAVLLDSDGTEAIEFIAIVEEE